MSEMLLPPRLAAKVQVTDEPCWTWLGQHSDRGYAISYLDGRMQRVHRVVFEKAFGTIPPGSMVDHVCFNKGCVNPKHLRLVSTKENGEHRSGAQANSSSGIRGVYWHKKCQKWAARVCHNGRGVHGGLFETVAEAEAAVVALRARLFTHDDAVVTNVNIEAAPHD